MKRQYLVIPKDSQNMIAIEADNFIVNADTNAVYFEDLDKKRYVAVFPLSGICGFKEVNGKIEKEVKRAI